MTAILKVDTIQDTAGNNIINESSDTITIGASGDTIALAGTTVTGITQGITGADQFRLSADFANDANPISSNLERVDNSTFAKIGNGMSLSSGVYTFPETGLWLVKVISTTERTSSNDNNMSVIIDTTSNGFTDGGVYVAFAITSGAAEPSTMQGFAETFYNVTNTSNNKVRFVFSSSGGNTLKGSSSGNETSFTFIRLGASQ